MVGGGWRKLCMWPCAFGTAISIAMHFLHDHVQCMLVWKLQASMCFQSPPLMRKDKPPSHHMHANLSPLHPPAHTPSRAVFSGMWNPRQDLKGVREIFLPSWDNYGSWLNILIILTPVGWIAHFMHWSAYAIFIINLVALIPLATIIGKLTEDLALRFGDTIGE